MPICASARIVCLLCLNLAPAAVHGSTRFLFEPNRGQTASEIRYLARTGKGAVFVTDDGVTMSGANQTAVVIKLSGMDSPGKWTPQDETGETVSYYIGRDRSRWVIDAPRFERLLRPHVYAGIDLVLYGAGEQLEYDFALAPHADPARIRLKLEGARRVAIAEDGALVVETAGGELCHHRPVLTEALPDGSRRNIAGAFRLLGRDEVGFAVSEHNPELALTIDPVIESATYFGGNGDDSVVATDGYGDMVGTTTSIDVPGATFLRRGGTDVFVSVGQSTLVIGGSGDQTVTSAAFDTSPFGIPPLRQLVVGGYTNSTDLPTGNYATDSTTPVLQPEYGGGATDGFLIFIGVIDGRILPAVTYVGGPGADRVNAVALALGTLAVGGETEGGLPVSIYFPESIRPNPRGGLDGFVMTASYLPLEPMTASSPIYLGGSGDDRVLGIATDGPDIYVTGETKSANFPLVNPLYHSLKGSSHAFVAKIGGLGQALAASTLFGGSGADQGVAINILPNGNVAVAGVTSSEDLPLRNATQKAYGGGASDAFLAQFAPDLSALVSSTFIGGSETDEATSIASAPPNTIFVGGWTQSTNFPVVRPVQKEYGGGSSDGFLAHFNDDGSLYAATYYGGSGSDQVLGVTARPLTGSTVWIAGSTTSPNLPLVSATQTSLRGSSDGFIAEISADLINAGAVVGGKDLRGRFLFAFGRRGQTGTPNFLVTSSDSAVVQVAADSTSTGQESITVTPFQPESAGAYFDCLSDTGGAKLTISATGYASRPIAVTCTPEIITVSPPFPYGPPIQTSISSTQPVSINFIQGPNVALPSDQREGPFVTRPGAPPVLIQVANSNASIGTVTPMSLALPSGQGVTFTPSAVGTTDLTFQAGNIPIMPAASIPLVVTGPYNVPTNVSLAVGFQTSLNLGQVFLPKPVAITSGDPDAITLSLDSTKKGGKSVTIPANGQPVWVQAFGWSGNVTLTINVPGQPDVSIPVQLIKPTVSLIYGSGTVEPLEIAVGGSATVQFALGLVPNPGNVVKFSLKPSAGNVVSIAPASIELTPQANDIFQVTGTAAGSVELTLVNSAKIPMAAGSRPVTVHVKNVPVIVSNVEVGKDLVALANLALPAPVRADTQVTLAVGDSTKALLSLDMVSAGLPQITAVIPRGVGGLTFYVYGIAGTGQTTVTASVPGETSATGTVTLDASGFYWSDDSVSVSVTDNPLPSILVGPLDATSLLPVNAQPLQPGVMGTLNIMDSNPAALTINENPVSLPSGLDFIAVTGVPTGNATLTLVQPQGFSTPSVRQTLAVSVTQ